MNSKEAGIYSITSKINGKRYIGSASRICTRWNSHKSHLRANKHHSQYLQNHYNKYGEDDLIFSVVEVIERGDLTLQEFKNLLLDKEQVYLNNWNECQFNSYKIAGSSLGCKRSNSKYYCYHKDEDLYKTYYLVDNKRKVIDSHILEEDAIKEVELLKTLSEQEIIKYYKELREKPPKNKRVKHYFFTNNNKKYNVVFKINGKKIRFGSYGTELEAVKQAEYINTLSIEEKIKYFNKRPPRVYKRKPNSKHYYFNKTMNKWRVQFRTKTKIIYSSFKTEQEAIDKVKEIKLELGIE